MQYLQAACPAWWLGLLLTHKQLLKAERREIALLRVAPRTRFAALLAEHPLLLKRVPLQYIASYPSKNALPLAPTQPSNQISLFS